MEDNHIRILEKVKSKRELTKEENKFLSQLKDDLSDAEGYVKEQIEDVLKIIK